MADTYPSFDDLARAETEGTDYRIITRTPGRSSVLHLAPHAGGIEPGTGECAAYCAGREHRLYLFEGIKPSGNSKLHITSTRFTEPNALALSSQAAYTIAWHGASGDVPQVFLSGADIELRERIATALRTSGFTIASTTPTEIDGDDPQSINQANRRSAGVQLELSTGLRASFFPNDDFSRAAREDPNQRTPAFYRFCDAIRDVLAAYDQPPQLGNLLDRATQSSDLDTKTWRGDSGTRIDRGMGGVGATEAERRYCLAITTRAEADATATTTYRISLAGQTRLHAEAALYPTVETPVTLTVRWYLADATTLVATSPITSAPIPRRWTIIADTVQVPAAAKYADLAITHNPQAKGQTLFVDRIYLGDPPPPATDTSRIPLRRVRLGYPRLGTRRTDIAFTTGINIIDSSPIVRSADDYAQVIIATGTGEGRSQRRQIAATRNGRLRLESVLDLPDIRAVDILAKRAAAERTWRSTLGTVEEITVRDHSAAPIGSWQVGDDVRVTIHNQWAAFSGWCRITSWALHLDGDGGETAVLKLAPSESYHYETIP